jgi:hypothetical protein
MPNSLNKPRMPVERGRALLDEALARAVHHQPRLLLQVLERHEAHVRALDGFTDRGPLQGASAETADPSPGD